MSKHETWRTREFHNKIGGLLIEEFIAVGKGKSNGKRIIDGVIVLEGPKKIHDNNFFNIENKDIICIQTKKNRLGMNVMGQAFFSREILKKFNPKSIRTVIVCEKDDSVLRTICNQFEIEIEIISEEKNESLKHRTT